MAKKILIVDDDPDVILFLSTMLRDNGYDTLDARNGREGLERAQAEVPDLILLDLLMPEETGTAFYRKLHRQKEFENIPVIFVSGLSGKPASVSKSIPVIDKPIEEKYILKEIQKILD